MVYGRRPTTCPLYVSPLTAIAVVSVLQLGLPGQLPAPMPSADATARFDEAFKRGEALYQQGEYGAAVFHFKRADAQRVTPEVAYDLAKCFERLGDPAFTAYYYRVYLRRAPTAADALEVGERLGALFSRAREAGLGYLEAEAPMARRLSVAGRRFPEPPVALLLPPGDYELQGEFGAGVSTKVVHVKGGEVSSVHFEARPAPLLASPSPLVSRAPVSSWSLGLRIGAGVTAGLGVVALLIASLMGGASVADGNRAADRSLSVSMASSLNQSANDKASTANVFFVVGGVAIAAAGGLLGWSFVPEGQRQ